MFGFKKKRIAHEDLPPDIQNKLELLEVEVMEGEDPLPFLKYLAKKFPGYVPARLNLAMFTLDRGDLAGARSVYKKVEKDFPDELGAIAGLATVLAAESKYDEAQSYAERALSAGYDWPPCYGVIAEALESRGELESAASYYLEGYRSSPHSWNYLEQYCRIKGRPFSPPGDEAEPCISLEQLDSLASYVDSAAHTPDSSGKAPGCDHTFKYAEKWAIENQVDTIELYQFLNRHGGFCDCEICFNVTQLLIEDSVDQGRLQ